MFFNPQVLCKKVHIEDVLDEVYYPHIDAIFIPTKNRIENLKLILRDLEYFPRPIYIFPSSVYGLNFIKNLKNHNCLYVLKFENNDFVKTIQELKTSKHNYLRYQNNWDLALKRNYILLFSKQMKYKNILFLDDDICINDFRKIVIGSKLLEEYSITGCNIVDELDISIMERIRMLHGVTVLPFMGGGFSFHNITKCRSFFPNIYNDDRLFLIPYIQSKSVCTFGNISQRINAFQKQSKIVRFQEFGEIIADGLYFLIYNNNYNIRFDIKFWEYVIYERKANYEHLFKTSLNSGHKSIIKNALFVNINIKADYCSLYVKNWEDDLRKWNDIINGI